MDKDERERLRELATECIDKASERFSSLTTVEFRRAATPAVVLSLLDALAAAEADKATALDEWAASDLRLIARTEALCLALNWIAEGDIPLDTVRSYAEDVLSEDISAALGDGGAA